MIDEGVSASRVVFHRVCCSAANEHFRSVNFVTHTPPPPPPSLHLQRTSVISVISPIGLCSFLTSLSSFRARALEIEGCMFESVYTGLFTRYFFSLFFHTPPLSLFLSLFFSPLCTRLSKPRFRMEKRTRYVSNYESGATFGYIDLWPLTRDDFFFLWFFLHACLFIIIFFFSWFFDSDILPFRFRIVEMEKECFRWLFRD